MLSLYLAALLAVPATQPLPLELFDEPLADRFEAVGPIEVRRDGQLGKIILDADGPAVLVAKQTADWERYGHIGIRMRSIGGPAVVEFQVFHDDGSAKRKWRKVEVPEDNYEVVPLPLSYFRDSGMSELGWPDLGRWAIRLRGAGVVEVDSIYLQPAEDDDTPARLDADEIRVLAFGDDGTVHAAGNFAVITDVDDLNADAALAKLDEMATMVKADFPDWPAPEHAVPLLVFEGDADYRVFWPKLGELFNSEIPEPTADGYCVLGIAGTSVGDPPAGQPLRSVAAHEAFHAYLAEALGLASIRGNWLHESLATYYQAELDGTDLHKLPVGKRIPMPELISGKRSLATHQYVQGAQLVGFMLDVYPQEFSRAVQAMAERADTDLLGILPEFFNVEATVLATEFDAWIDARTKQR